MSTWTPITVACSTCRTTTSTRIATSVHIARVPEARTAVLDRSFHRVRCAACQHLIEIEHAVTYVDVERGHWIQIEPTARRSEWRELEQTSMRAVAHALDLSSPLVSGLARSSRRRLVFGTEELREKLVVWDAGIDDELVECMKARMILDDPSFASSGMIVDRVSEDGGLELVRFDRGQPPRKYGLPASDVDRALDERGSLAARFPELFNGGFVNLLRLLALVLVVMGCSQPVPRDPAPRAKDAATPDAMSVDAAAVTDAAVTDAAVPVDAAPDMEGHWKFLRSRRVPGDMMRTAAIVVRQETRAAGVFIKLDRGRDYGVKKGWKGRFINDDGKLVFDVFEVSDVERSSATASTTATSDMVANTRRVILWDPEHGDENGW